MHWSPHRYCGPENLHVACVTFAYIVIVAAEKLSVSHISYIQGESQGSHWGMGFEELQSPPVRCKLCVYSSYRE